MSSWCLPLHHHHHHHHNQHHSGERKNTNTHTFNLIYSRSSRIAGARAPTACISHPQATRVWQVAPSAIMAASALGGVSVIVLLVSVLIMAIFSLFLGSGTLSSTSSPTLRTKPAAIIHAPSTTLPKTPGYRPRPRPRRSSTRRWRGSAGRTGSWRGWHSCRPTLQARQARIELKG